MKYQFSFHLLLACHFIIAYSYKLRSEEEDPHPCKRTCTLNEEPKICNYTFKIENYYTMTKACHDCPYNQTDCLRTDCIPGDGNYRSVVAVNRMIPGPAIEVCLNDLVVVDVENDLMSDSTSIHWHGQPMTNYPYMDGVPFVTQCPILPRTSFRYQFNVTQAGTHFWHSHFGMQRVDGCFGPFIVRVPEEENPHTSLYDYDLSEHTIIAIDWDVVSGLEKFLFHYHNIGNNKPTSFIVNGMGRKKEFVTLDSNETIYTPVARFFVEQGYKYRFRLISAGFQNCPVEFSVDNHKITVISSDGEDIYPTEADSLVAYAGERFDFVLNANQSEGLFWMRFRGLMDCDERYQKAFQVAVLEYSNSSINVSEVEDFTEADDTYKEKLLRSIEIGAYPDTVPDYDNCQRLGRVGDQINSLNEGTETDNSDLTIPKLSSVRGWDERLREQPDYQFYLAYDFYRIDNPHFYGPGYEFYDVSPDDNQVLTPQLNHISMKIPSFPLLSQRDEITSDMFCNQETMTGTNCSIEFCECPHAYQIPLGSIVELIIIDEGLAYDANHPIHLHGFKFRVVAMERVARNITVEQVKTMEAEGTITRNLLDAPLKDTVTVPDGGFTIVRLEANNPGFWIIHCHLEFHAEVGMALVFKIGEDDEMPPVPDNFPKCGNYLPQVDEITSKQVY